MVEFLYRFRSLNALLGPDDGYEQGRAELEKQTIYFAAPDELNDPVEGFKDVFWRGDWIVWRNLFKHYLLCLEETVAQFSIIGGEGVIERENIPVFVGPTDLPTVARQAIHKEISEQFFRHESMAGYPEALAARRSPVRYNELSLHLKRVHLDALNCVLKVFKENGLIAAAGPDFHKPVGQVPPAEFCRMLNEMDEQHPDSPGVVEDFLASQTAIVDQLTLIERYDPRLPGQAFDNFLFLVNQFPNEYTIQVQTLIYPKWYAASFSAGFENASLWGHYAQNHTGVCLKFRVHDKGETINLPVPMITGYGGGLDDPRTYISTVDVPFEKIQYATARPAVDFFRSISLPIPKLNATWYVGPSGERSVCHDDVFSEHEIWRRGYWKSCQETMTTKTEDWAYEEEYRLLISGFMTDYSDRQTRIKNFDFADLEGIVFGIKTPPDKKLAIMRIIDRKCTTANRTDFKFFQAYYCRTSGKIKAMPLGLLTPGVVPKKPDES